MDEQRCELPKPIEKSKSTEDMLDMVERVQGDRMEEQRSDLPSDGDPSQMLRKFDSHTLCDIVAILKRTNIALYHIDTDEIPGFFHLLRNHIFIARSEDTIFMFHR